MTRLVLMLEKIEKRVKYIFRFLLLARYVPNVAKAAILENFE